MGGINRFDVFLAKLDPTFGSEVKKTRPCLIVSPSEMHDHLHTVIVIPLTTTCKPYRSRMDIEFANKKGQLVFDQIRAIDKHRLVKRLGNIESSHGEAVCEVLQDLFAY